MDSSALSVGLIGIGGVGGTHARALHQVPGVRLERYSGGTCASGRETGWPRARQVSVEDLLTDRELDVVGICSPSQLHGSTAIEIARSGRHVVVEKPMALSNEDAAELVRLQEEQGVVVGVVSQRRYEPANVAVKELLAGGAIGDVRLVVAQMPWYRGEDYFTAAPWRGQEGGGSLLNQGVHVVDLIRWLCGPVVSVTAQQTTQAAATAAEDTTVATLRFASGALGMLATSTATPPGHDATVAIYTTEGMLELAQGTISRWELPQPRPSLDDDTPSEGSATAAVGTAGHVIFWTDVVKAIREGRRPELDAREGAATTAVLCGIGESARTGRLMELADLAQ